MYGFPVLWRVQQGRRQPPHIHIWYMFLLLKQRMKPVSEPIVRHCYDVRLLIGEGNWDLPLFEKQRIENVFCFIVRHV